MVSGAASGIHAERLEGPYLRNRGCPGGHPSSTAGRLAEMPIRSLRRDREARAGSASHARAATSRNGARSRRTGRRGGSASGLTMVGAAMEPGHEGPGGNHPKAAPNTKPNRPQWSPVTKDREATAPAAVVGPTCARRNGARSRRTGRRGQPSVRRLGNTRPQWSPVTKDREA